jgi:hypothetical protein
VAEVNLLSDTEVVAEIQRRAALLSGSAAGKMTVELNLKDGKWTLGNVSVTFPRRHG